MQNELYHHGILGQKWGIRRYQNDDGTLTEAGKRRYQSSDFRKNYQNRLNDLDTAMAMHKKDTVESLKKIDEYAKRQVHRSAKDRAKALKQLMKTPVWRMKDATSATFNKKKLKNLTEIEWAKIERASAYVNVGKQETNQILRELSKSDMGLKSEKVSKATFNGKRYYDLVKSNTGGSNESYKLSKMENTYQDDGSYWYRTDVMGTKYKVSNRPHGKYKSLRGD